MDNSNRLSKNALSSNYFQLQDYYLLPFKRPILLPSPLPSILFIIMLLFPYLLLSSPLGYYHTTPLCTNPYLTQRDHRVVGAEYKTSVTYSLTLVSAEFLNTYSLQQQLYYEYNDNCCLADQSLRKCQSRFGKYAPSGQVRYVNTGLYPIVFDNVPLPVIDIFFPFTLHCLASSISCNSISPVFTLHLRIFQKEANSIA